MTKYKSLQFIYILILLYIKFKKQILDFFKIQFKYFNIRTYKNY